MAPTHDGGFDPRSIFPPEVQIPKNVDPTTFWLSQPALSENYIPPGADRTMTLDGPDQVWYLVVAITCIAIPGLFMIMRLYTKLVIERSLEVADYFIFLALPMIITEIAVGYYMIKYGAGVHQWQITYQQLFQQLYWVNVGQIVYCPLSFVVKMAILLQYLRLFAPQQSANRTVWFGAWITIVSCFCFYTALMFWTMFYCHPREMIWNKFIPQGHCSDGNDIILSQGAFNMASDIVILLLPTSSLWRLNVPLRRKVAVTLLFATGLLACVASAMRIVITLKISAVISKADVSYYGLFIGLWTEAEVSLGLVVACSLCLPKLIQAKSKQIHRAISYASSPFSPRGTSRCSSRSRSASNRSISWGTAHTSPNMLQTRIGKQPMYHESTELYFANQYPKAHTQPLWDSHPHSIQGSSEYSQSTGSVESSDDEFDSDSIIPAPLNVRGSCSTDPSSPGRLPKRTTRGTMTAEQLQAELDALQQFDFSSIHNSFERGFRPERASRHIL